MIRLFKFSDLDSILNIERLSFPKSPYSWATFVNLHYLYPKTFWVYVNTTQDQNKKEGQILGYIIFSQDGHIISIAIHPQHRRKGIGKELVQRAITESRMKKAWAEVRKSNKGAQAFYSHMGFRVVGEVPNYYENEDALIVQWVPTETETR